MASHPALRHSAACFSRLSRPFQLPVPAASWTRTAAFSSTTRQCKRKTKDNNKKRGVSSLYRSGPREHLSMSDVPLPKPRDYKPKVAVDKKHGLWGFFPAPGKLIPTPQEAESYGRAWTVEELRKKSWDDLHALWWVCCKERNMLATSKAELLRSKIGFGETEIGNRDDEVKKTMRRIKHTLTERFYLWEDANAAAKTDPEIDLEAEDGKVYKPLEPEDEATKPDSWSEPANDGAEISAALQGKRPEAPSKEAPGEQSMGTAMKEPAGSRQPEVAT